MNSASSTSEGNSGREPKRLYKVSFELSDEAKRWAPANHERVWTEKSDAKMEVFVRNVPFYIRGISSGDRIRVRADHETRELVFEQIVEKSGNSTVRAIVKANEGRQSLEEALIDCGCSWEIDTSGLLWAIDVPVAENYARLHLKLSELVKTGLVEIEEASVSDKHEADLSQ